MGPIFPVYHQIRRSIKHAILEKQFLPNDPIPTEKELAAKFNVNRLTVRQALSLLVQKKLLIRKPGKGTFVTSDNLLIEKMCLKRIGLVDELLLPLMKSKTLGVEIEKVVAGPLVRKKLELHSEESEVFRIKRDRLVPDDLRAFTINYVPIRIGSRLKKGALLKKPLLKIMEDDLKIIFSEAFQTIELSLADEEIARHLDIQIGNPTILTERIVYDEMGKPIEMVETFYNAYIYKFGLHVKRVKRGDESDWLCKIVQ